MFISFDYQSLPGLKKNSLAEVISLKIMVKIAIINILLQCISWYSVSVSIHNLQTPASGYRIKF